MIRWRCHRRACRRKTYRRRSTKSRFPVPVCRGCKNPMRIDHYRTSRKEKRKGNCGCAHVKWVPHQHSYCQKLIRLQYAESCVELPDPEVPF